MRHDLRFALRSIWRSKVFALTAILAFSFGIATTATVFSVVDAVLLRPATFPDRGHVIAVQSAEKNKDWEDLPVSLYDRLRSRSDLFSEVAASRIAVFTVTRVPNPDQVFGLSLSGNYLRIAGAHPLIGRMLTADDDKPGAPPVVLLSHNGWQKLFGKTPGVVGKTAEIDGESHEVIGVMPPDFVLPGGGSSGALWTTLRLSAAELAAPNARSVRVIARLRPSVTLAAAQAALDAMTRSEARQMRVSQWRNETDPDRKLTLWLAMAMVLGLLIIGCANLASIVLARAIARRRDYAIRLATGASRARLIRECLLEVCLLSLAALIVASAGTDVALHSIRDHLSVVQANVPDLARIHLNAAVLLFSFAISLVAALICGAFPAFAATSIDLSTGLRDFGPNAGGIRSSRRFLYALLAVEAGVSMLLLMTSGVLVRSLSRLLTEDHALRPDRVLTLRLPTGSWQGLSRKQTEEERGARIHEYLELMQQAESIHGVQAAALSSSLPLSHAKVTTRIQAPSTVASAERTEILPVTQSVTRDYFRAMGIPILSGRTFAPTDAASKQKIALVNETFAKTYFNGENPIGRLLVQSYNKETIEIVGLVRDSPHLDLAERIEPEVYIDFEQSLLTPFLTGLVVRTQSDPELLVNTLRRALSIKDADQPVVQVRTLQSLIDENVWQRRFSAWLFSGFAFLALCLSGIGIYGVVAYITASRRRDFGIRLAIGANPSSVFRLAATQSLAPVLLGIGIGALGSYGTTRLISSLLYRTRPFDPEIVVLSIAVLLLLAFAAAGGPALRAARVDPAITLRAE